MSDKLHDGLQFTDDDEKIIFNHYSFGEIIKRIMVKYGEVTYSWADERFKKSLLSRPPKSVGDITFLSHELEFHWAMLLVHGEMYWQKGIPSNFNDFKDEHIAWEKEIRQKFNLLESFDFLET